MPVKNRASDHIYKMKSMEYLGTNKIINKLQPLVSVCVPTYNHGQYIRQCIEGILMQQTRFTYEIIIGEDESADDTRNICIEYAQKYPDKIRLFLRSRKDVISVNGRPSGRYNFIENLKAARGQFIALCDGDDYWTDPNKLQKQADFLANHSKYAICFHDAFIIDEQGHTLSDSFLSQKFQKDKSSEDIISAFMTMPTLTVMFRNGIIHQFQDPFFKVVNVDSFFYALLAQHGSGKYIGDIKPACYRKHPGGVWSSLNECQKFTQIINTHTNLLSLINKENRWIVKRTLYFYNTLIVPFKKGPFLKINQYVYSYKFFSFKIGFINRFLIVHQLLIKRILNSSRMHIMKFIKPKYRSIAGAK